MDLTLKNISDALAELCAQHVSLGADNYFRFDMEFSEKMAAQNLFGEYVMLMQPMTTFFTGQTEAQTYKRVRVEFSILAPGTTLGNYDGHEDDINNCEVIATEIIKRIRHYSENFGNSPVVFSTFDYRTLNGAPIMLEADNRSGFSYSFELYEFIPLVMDESKWNDL